MFSCARGVAFLLALPCTYAESPEDRIVEAFSEREGFLWGTATASYQVEGAWNRDGKQPSIWDVFSHTPGKTYMNETGDVADNFYDLYEQDVDRVAAYGFNAFRFSVSWPRVFPKGADGVHRPNPKGISFYKSMISRLIGAGVTPLLTLFHWDLPDDLDWLDGSVADAFAEYADLMFQSFPEVKHWLTFNEPLTFCPQGYESGTSAPGKPSQYGKYLCGHNVLRAHAKAVAIYRSKYQQAAGGKIGITLSYSWAYPWNVSSPGDQAAAQLRHDFSVGWWADPVFLTGDYPASMRQHLGEHLPTFTPAEVESLKGSSDFYGLNSYTAIYAKAPPAGSEELFETTHTGIDGKLIGERAASSWLYVCPSGIRDYMEYINSRYQPASIVITENGVDVPGENDLTLSDALEDTFRVNYYRSYLDGLAASVREVGVPLDGYFAWSLLDNYEWADGGYHLRFGITYVNYTTQERFAKNSAKWFTQLLARMPRSESHVELV